jgi:fructose-1,6-bisphosphatase/inositol monophosphatase family enzyme
MEGELLVSEGAAVYHAKVRPASNAPARLEIFSLPAVPVDGKMPIAIAQRSLRECGYTGQNVLHATASAVFSLVHVMLGHYLAYKADLKLWDLAGSLALLAKLGCAACFGDGGVFGTRITDENYELDAAAGFSRWRARGRPVFAASGEAARYVMSCFQPR